jgi:hypothetical protein
MGTQTRTVVTCGECGTDPKTAQVDWNHLTDLFRAVTSGVCHRMERSGVTGGV